MRRPLLAAGTALAALVALAPNAVAVVDHPDLPEPGAPGDLPGALPDAAAFDVRATAGAVAPTEEQLAAVAGLAGGDAGTPRVTWDDRFGTPRTVLAYGSDLSGPRGGTAPDVARAWVSEQAALLGLSAADVDALALTGDHVLPGTGTHVVTFAQVFDGVQAARGGSMTVAVREDGSVVSYAGATVRSSALGGSFALSAADALTSVAGELAGATDFVASAAGEQAGFTTFDRGPFAAGSYVKQVAFPTADGARAAHRVLFVEALDAAWDVVVDAETGEVLYRDSVVAHAAEGTVYENHPGDEGDGGQPVVRSFGPTEESPSGWVDPSGLLGLPGPTTTGNNANTYANYSNFLVPADQGPRPVSPTSRFNYSYAQNWARSEGSPTSYPLDLDPAATNLFFHHNRIHDEYYALGFTESGDNFQLNNGAQEGGGDPILGLVHAGAATGGAPTYTGRDNAYMLTLPDGIPPWSGMFLWEPIEDAFEGPYSDGNFDAGVIQHEYTHGLTNRYVSAEDGALGSHQSGSMGEGWGDWYALDYLHREGLTTSSAVGQHVTGNDDRGIRNWSYDENPTGFGDIGYDIVGAEVHSDGEIWTTILWDVRKALVERYGQAEGSDIATRLVTDAMPLSPTDPSFLDMRDAIVKALDNRYHARGDYRELADLVYTAFAARGAGLHATTEGGADTDPVPAFDAYNTALNGTLAGRVVNASTGQAVEGARVIIGELEARVTPLRESSSNGGFSAPVVAGTYPVTVQAPGFGSHTFPDVEIAAGEATRLRLPLAPNLASTANGASVVSATSPQAGNLLDDTEASSWKADRGTGHVVVELAEEADLTSVQVSAFTSSRFEGLKSFTLQTSRDGVVWDTVRSGQAFDYAAPRPAAPDVHYRTFDLAEPVRAKFVRFYTDEPFGETKTSVQAAELQVFAERVRGVTPLPPEPPDEPVTDSGTIAAGNPGSDSASGVTMAELEATCTLPLATQGTDGWVTELPESFGDGLHTVQVTGDSVAPYDLDVYFYDADCQRTGSAASSASDESGTIPSGTTYVVSQLWLGAGVPVTITATDTA